MNNDNNDNMYIYIYTYVIIIIISISGVDSGGDRPASGCLGEVGFEACSGPPRLSQLPRCP